ncbi:MAG: S8/S53 family peptidase [Actinobacteria bacterium]|nr:S8/S53 family peptidase [Actinomycetota bacterium]
MSQPRHELPGSYRAPVPGADYVADVDPDERIELTLVLRRRAALEAQTVAAGELDRQQLQERYGADPADVERVRAELPGTQIVTVDPASRRVRLAVTARQAADLFGVRLTVVDSPDPLGAGRVRHRQREGTLSVPEALAGVILAVLGLDDRPQSRAHYRVAGSGAGELVAHAAGTSYTPLELDKIYSMPAGTDGSGQIIAIIELGGGFGSADLTHYFDGLGLTAPNVTAIGVDGATNVVGKDPSGADGEVLLDIEVAGAIAPKADIIVYFGPNTDAGFLDAVSTAAHADPTPTVISISWGQNEDAWTAQARTAMDQAFADAAAMGVTVTAAAGDNGSGDAADDGEVHADFPASSPHVLGCGGTSLHADADSGLVSTETVWNNGTGGGATGGGVSDVFPVPSWQSKLHVPKRSGASGTGRGVPDVAAVADPQTGYQVYVDGKDMIIGGTSAVAPLWAGLIARLVQSTGTRLGLLQPALYAAKSGLRDITTGNNGAYPAGKGWDACTGLGVPVGDELLTALGKHANNPKH